MGKFVNRDDGWGGCGMEGEERGGREEEEETEGKGGGVTRKEWCGEKEGGGSGRQGKGKKKE